MKKPLTEGKTLGSMSSKEPVGPARRPIRPPPAPKPKTEELTTKVTNINGRYHCRLLKGDKVLSEMACVEQADIGFCMTYLLRWHDKLGGTSQMADKSRHRGKNDMAKGKIWYPSQIPIKE